MLSEECRYAIKAMIFINSHKSTRQKISLLEVVQAINSPIAFTAKILQQLRRHGLLKSAVGAQGGYWISSEKIISLKSIIEIIDGDEIFSKCILGLKSCTSLTPCPLHQNYMTIKDQFHSLMDKTYLDDYTEGLKSKKIKLKL